MPRSAHRPVTCSACVVRTICRSALGLVMDAHLPGMETGRTACPRRASSRHPAGIRCSGTAGRQAMSPGLPGCVSARKCSAASRSPRSCSLNPGSAKPSATVAGVPWPGREAVIAESPVRAVARGSEGPAAPGSGRGERDGNRVLVGLAGWFRGELERCGGAWFVVPFCVAAPAATGTAGHRGVAVAADAGQVTVAHRITAPRPAASGVWPEPAAPQRAGATRRSCSGRHAAGCAAWRPGPADGLAWTAS
jgi:hypothetical protein